MGASELVSGCAIWCNPDGPDLPFGSFWLSVWDFFRILCVIGGITVLIMLPTAIARTRVRGQWARLIAFGLLVLLVINTELSHLGDDASVRLGLSVAGIAFAVLGMVKMRDESPSSRRAA